MSALEVGNKLVELCRQGKNMEAIESLYADDIASVEAMEAPGFPREMNGLEAVKGKAKWWVENHEVHSAEAHGPYQHGEDRFAVVFKMDVTSKMDNQRRQMNEVGVYTVKDGKVSREEFFYTMG